MGLAGISRSSCGQTLSNACEGVLELCVCYQRRRRPPRPPEIALQIMMIRKYPNIRAGDPIAQIIFFGLESPTEIPYEGKYQDREAGPQRARTSRA